MLRLDGEFPYQRVIALLELVRGEWGASPLYLVATPEWGTDRQITTF